MSNTQNTTNQEPIKKSKKVTIIRTIAMVLAAVLLLGIVFLNRDMLSRTATYSIESTSEVSFGQNGQTLVIDNGKKTLLVINEEGKLIRRYDGGGDDTPFYYACHAAQAEDGSIYVADIKYGERGNLLDWERIIKLNGSESQVLMEIDYTKAQPEDTPLQYGRILELQVYNDTLYFTIDTIEGVEVYRMEPDGTFACALTILFDSIKKTDAAYDVRTNTLAVASRNGEVCIFDGNTDGQEVLEELSGMMVFDMDAKNGEFYFTELLGQNIWHVSADDPSNMGIYHAMDDLDYKMGVSEDGRNVLITNYAGYYRLTGDQNFNGEIEDYVDTAANAGFAKTVMLWIALALGGLIALYLIFQLSTKILSLAGSDENVMRVILIVTASLIVSFVVSYVMLSKIMDSNTLSSEKQVSLIADTLSGKIDTTAISMIDQPSDYGTERYAAIKAPLDETINTAYEREDYYYYMIYRAIDGKVVYIMDYEDTLPCTYPVYEDDPDLNEYAAVLHTGEELLVSEISNYGAWTFLLRPIVNESGEIVAELEVGQSLDVIQRNQAKLRWEMIINTAISTVVVTMLLLELTFLLKHIQRRRSAVDLDTTQLVPLRTLMFLIYLADSMQDAFIAILCSQLYQGGLPFADGVAIALPMSAQLLMMAMFSLFAGRLVERMGSRRVISGGMLVNMAGFLICLILGSYTGILLGKMLIGAGMGTIYVSCNSVAATGGSSALMADASADVSAGTLAGLTIGAGLASMLLSMGGWRLIYLVGAIIIGLGLLLALSSGNVLPGKKQTDETEEVKGISLREFLFNRRVLGFFALVLVPFMMALSYREYFFPLFAEENGINEVRIGQIYLACGMLVLYIGPFLSSWMIKRLGAFWSILAASAAMGVNMLMFVFFPSLGTVIAGVVVLSLIISFAYTCQYTYFELTPETSKFGEGRAMGVYSVFESLGQTIGPVAYGALLALGYVKGIAMFSEVMLLLIGIFIVLMYKHGKDYR